MPKNIYLFAIILGSVGGQPILEPNSTVSARPMDGIP